SDVGENADIAVCDVSFISQTYIHSGAFDILSDSGDFIGLIKPQFETEKRFISKGGVVKEPKVRIDAVKRVLESLSKTGFFVLGLIKSPIKGGDGNTEYLVWASRREGTEISDARIRRTVCEENSNTAKER
ncbi:MAG: SAM-dependent methyltransferase, partial [Lachnospiraceae bacterium]